MIGGRVLDSSALTDAATGRSIYAQALIRTSVDAGIVLAVPAAALLTAWSTIAPAHRPFLDLLLDLPEVVLEAVDGPAAREAGLVLAGVSPAVVDRVGAGSAAAHAVVIARRRGWPVVTAEAESISALAPEVEVEQLP